MQTLWRPLNLVQVNIAFFLAQTHQAILFQSGEKDVSGRLPFQSLVRMRFPPLAMNALEEVHGQKIGLVWIATREGGHAHVVAACALHNGDDVLGHAFAKDIGLANDGSVRCM